MYPVSDSLIGEVACNLGIPRNTIELLCKGLEVLVEEIEQFCTGSDEKQSIHSWENGVRLGPVLSLQPNPKEN